MAELESHAPSSAVVDFVLVAGVTKPESSNEEFGIMFDPPGIAPRSITEALIPAPSRATAETLPENMLIAPFAISTRLDD